jgi:plasmid maintenance system antidote protein VapI
MDGPEMSEVLRQIGWQVPELAHRLNVRPGTVYDWLTGRRHIPDNLADWLRRVRDHQANAGALPEGWRAV